MKFQYDITHFYSFKAKHSKKFLGLLNTSGPFAQDYTGGNQSGRLVQIENNQEFFLVPIDGMHFYIVPKNGTKVLDISNELLGQILQGFTGKQVLLYSPHGGNNQRFIFEESETQGYYYIRAKDSEKVLDVYKAEHKNYAEIVEWTKNNQDNQKFAIIKESSIKSPKRQLECGTVLSNIDQPIPRINNENVLPPSETQPILIGECFIPFLFVTDKSMSPDEQAKHSPLYLLRRQQLWKRHSCIPERFPSAKTTKEFDVETGITETTNISLENTLNFKFEPKLGFSYKEQTLGIGLNIDEELKIKISKERIFTQKTTERVKVDIEANNGYIIALWNLVDRYTLLRTPRDYSKESESVVETWDISIPNVLAKDVYIIPNRTN